MSRPGPLLCLCLSLAAGSAAAASPPAAGEEQRRYDQCISLARSKPADGWENALAWQGLGGGEAARHCAAVALIGLGEHEEAAMRLESLAQESRRGAQVRAGMLGLAAQAWLQAGQVQQALNDQSAALRLAPKDVDLLIDRATTYGTAGDVAAALSDLTQALALAPKRADAFALRATAHRLQGDLSAAERDVSAALKLDPNQAEALLEAGVTARLRAQPAQARRVWLKLLQVAPDSPAAEAARQNIERLDVRGADH
jgi:regulator of sirC expression with transglutaminase-like and TPR domain